MAAKSDRLLDNFTSNLAEKWISVRTKFDGGRLYQNCDRGSWLGRCYGGDLKDKFGTWVVTLCLGAVHFGYALKSTNRKTVLHINRNYNSTTWKQIPRRPRVHRQWYIPSVEIHVHVLSAMYRSGGILNTSIDQTIVSVNFVLRNSGLKTNYVWYFHFILHIKK